MTESEKIHRAEHAKQLLADDLFAEMLTSVRFDALNALAGVNPDDKTEIMRQQAIVSVTGDIRSLLEAAILATGEKDGGFSLQNSSAEE